jgi:cell division protein ZapA
MSALNININGREYRVACDDGQEVHLRRVAGDLDARIQELSRAMGPATPDSLLLVIASLMLTDELHDARREAERLRGEAGSAATQAAQPGEREAMQLTFSGTIHEIAERIEHIAGRIEDKIPA